MSGRVTSLSAGAIIRDILLRSEKVGTVKIYPIVQDEAVLPYIVYRRMSLLHDPSKALCGADTVQIEILCLDADYTRSVELAEGVRSALEYAQGEKDGLRLRSCTLTDSEEFWQDDAYVQRLVFNVKL